MGLGLILTHMHSQAYIKKKKYYLFLNTYLIVIVSRDSGEFSDGAVGFEAGLTNISSAEVQV